MSSKGIGVLVVSIAVLTGCSMSTTISARQQVASVQVREKSYSALPATDGGYLALDILFFAPGTFYNLRGVFPKYEIDVDEQTIRYRSSASDSWVEYKPSPAETERARRYFGASHQGSGSRAVRLGYAPSTDSGKLDTAR